MARIALSMIAATLLALGAAPEGARGQAADLPILPATTTDYPSGVKTAKAPGGAVYVDARGLVLYGMDLRTLLRWAPNPALYCRDACGAGWEPLLAPSGSTPNIEYPRGFGDRSRAPAPGQANRPPGPPPPPAGFVQPQSAPDWTVIAGPAGPQWVYKGWHMVFTRKGARPGSTEFEGAQNLTWNTLKFVPPVPQVAAPPGVRPVFADGAYALADNDGRILFTGPCPGGCPGWTPLAGGMASRGFGEWTVATGGDRPQWAWRGKPVYVSRDETPTRVPAGGTAVRP